MITAIAILAIYIVMINIWLYKLNKKYYELQKSIDKIKENIHENYVGNQKELKDIREEIYGKEGRLPEGSISYRQVFYGDVLKTIGIKERIDNISKNIALLEDYLKIRQKDIEAITKYVKR